jgi:hypothetical protein
MSVFGPKKIGLPAEGLLGAARLALRVALKGDRRRRCAPTSSNPLVCLSGVRMTFDWLSLPDVGIRTQKNWFAG